MLAVQNKTTAGACLPNCYLFPDENRVNDFASEAIPLVYRYFLFALFCLRYLNEEMTNNSLAELSVHNTTVDEPKTRICTGG